MRQSRRNFLRWSAAAALTAACKTVAPAASAAPAPAEAGTGPGQNPFPGKELSILSWNIFMLQGWLGESPRNPQRAAAQAAALIGLKYDILCLQKVFDEDAVGILKAALGGTYPYQHGPANHSFSLKESSGIWVLSRHPLISAAEIQFADCAGAECLSRNGAILLKGWCGTQPFQLVASHLQGEENDSFSKRNMRVRARQMEQIRDQLLLPNLTQGVPVFICGDFSTPHFETNTAIETDAYKRMKQVFEADSGRLRSITIDNDTESVTPPRADDELEYVLARENGCHLEIERTRYLLTRTGWDPETNRNDLAYRRAIGARIHFQK
ncbi:MAG TPA: endonuclease/exonuclease/phosphatase family protein [Candidatus Solibacter sp.]|nr:endonuclease/exonuclease/phosphatase family protein [Candidatus Solibacter sp.]